MEVTRDQLQKIIELSGADTHVDGIDSHQLSRLLVLIERKLNFFSVPMELEVNDDFSVLVVDDLELSIYQFTKVLRKIGIVPSIARNKEEAVAEIKKKKFDYMVIDLFLPDLSDGMSLIEEAVKLKETSKSNCKIITMSSTDDKAIIEKCLNIGIDHFVPKAAHWHNDVLKYMAQTIKGNDVQSSVFNKFLINNDIVVYSLSKINNPKYIDELLKDVNLSLALGHKHLIINFEKIKSFDMDNANFFSDIYKIIVSQGGKVVFVMPSEQIQYILEEIYLSEIIPTANSIDAAIGLINS